MKWNEIRVCVWTLNWSIQVLIKKIMCALDFDLFNLTKGDTTAERDGVLFGSGAPPDFVSLSPVLAFIKVITPSF